MFPSLILEKDPESNLGAVYLGGFQSAVNEEFIEKENVTHILNVAGKALGLFFGPRNRVCSCIMSSFIMLLSSFLQYFPCNISGAGLLEKVQITILLSPLQENAKRIHKKFNVNVLDLDWEDNMKFQITNEDFRQAAVFIQQGRKSGGSVLVHCAQVIMLFLVVPPLCKTPFLLNQ